LESTRKTVKKIGFGCINRQKIKVNGQSRKVDQLHEAQAPLHKPRNMQNFAGFVMLSHNSGYVDPNETRKYALES
jgi:hypothetical protein